MKLNSVLQELPIIAKIVERGWVPSTFVPRKGCLFWNDVLCHCSTSEMKAKDNPCSFSVAPLYSSTHIGHVRWAWWEFSTSEGLLVVYFCTKRCAVLFKHAFYFYSFTFSLLYWVPWESKERSVFWKCHYLSLVWLNKSLKWECPELSILLLILDCFLKSVRN